LASKDTKERILDAAERLFAAHGFAGTSLRAVTKEAGVNLAAVHYHFGTKEDLLRAVLSRIVIPVNRERLEMLRRGAILPRSKGSLRHSSPRISG
jgi:AcrR family transcriptional regulator